jgi:hypothetical protein
MEFDGDEVEIELEFDWQINNPTSPINSMNPKKTSINNVLILERFVTSVHF